MATTTNFGWETPDNTDLVKDGAAAMRTLGNAIDASFVDLKGGTTGQILSKASNTDLDYTWVSPNPGDITEVTAGTGISGGGTSGAVTITNSMATAIDAKGDLIAGTGADTFSRLAVGTNGQALLADSTTATGLKWGTVAGFTGYTSYSPGFYQGTTNLASSIDAYYCVNEKFTHVIGTIVSNGSGTSSNYIKITLPSGITTTGSNPIVGVVRLYDQSANSNYYGFALGDTSEIVFTSGLNKTNSTTSWWGHTTSDFNNTLAANDQIFFDLIIRDAV